MYNSIVIFNITYYNMDIENDRLRRKCIMKPIDRQNVFETCQALNDQGQKPTLDRVRKALGGGSFTTIQPLLREWKDGRSVSPAAAAVAVPEDIRAMMEALGSQIWGKASQKAAEELKVLRTSMEGKLEEAYQEGAEATAEVQRLETTLGEKEEKLKAFEERSKDLEVALRAANVEIQVQSKQLVEGEPLLKRHEKLLLEVGELRGRLAYAMETKKK